MLTSIIALPRASFWHEPYDVFMYGDVAHANEDKRQEYQKWMKATLHCPRFLMFLEETIADLTNCIFLVPRNEHRTGRFDVESDYRN